LEQAVPIMLHFFTFLLENTLQVFSKEVILNRRFVLLFALSVMQGLSLAGEVAAGTSGEKSLPRHVLNINQKSYWINSFTIRIFCNIIGNGAK